MGDGKWWDIYSDYYLPFDNYSSLSIENHFWNKFLTPPKTKNLKYLTFYDTILNLQRIWKKPKINLTHQEQDFLKDLTEQFYSLFQIRIMLETLVKAILVRRERILPIYLKLQNKIQPKAVLIVVSYSHFNFIEACNTLNIPTIELQHGIISRYHVGYSFESPNTKIQTYPDYMFTFGKYWNNCELSYPKRKFGCNRFSRI